VTGDPEAMSDYFKHPQALVESEDVGEGTRVWAFAHVMRGARIGRHCNIGDHCFVESGADVGDHVTLKNGVSVWDKVRIESYAFLGPNVALTNDLVPRSGQEWVPVGTVIRQGASVGANATVICGVEIGIYAMVGAGAVVSRDVPAYALVYGNPARVRGYVCQCARTLTFDGDRAVCAHCGKAFAKSHGAVVPC
jgi:UDP-2-acetamido-3-amino-2,3-dideoxy-glucuronate N-acetyltransferase